MPRPRDPNRDRAYEIWRAHSGNITNRQIAEQLGVNEKVIAVWKQRDKWTNGNVVQQTSKTTKKTTKTKVVQQKEKRGPGAPKGNKNAVGNRGGGPLRNDKAVKHGFFRKYFPEDAAEIIQEIETRSPLDILWENIVIQYTAIIRAQRIMYVRDQDDLTRVLKREKDSDTVSEREWELQFAWDKQANFLQAQSRAMGTLQSMIKQYEELCRQGFADEEQQLRIDKLKAEVEDIKGGGKNKSAEEWTEALSQVLERRRAKMEEGEQDE